MTDRPLHFWLPQGPPEGFAVWDPDTNPGMYPSGVGHAVLELARRLEHRGRVVTVGADGPPGAAWCFHVESLWDWTSGAARPDAHAQLLAGLRNAASVTAIRGDIPLSFRPSVPSAVEVMPSRATAVGEGRTWLPLLPQRGLIPRAPERRGAIRTLAVFAFEINVPEHVASGRLAAELEPHGVEVVSRTWDGISQSVPDWHDFSCIDAALCVTADRLGTGLERKPPTKLVNAWVAGAVPVFHVGQPSYAELARPGVDSIPVQHADAVAEALAVHGGREALGRLERGIAERAAEFNCERILDLWARLLDRPADLDPVAVRRAYTRAITRSTAARVARRLGR